MAQNNAPPVSLEARRSIVARPLGNETVLTLIGAGDPPGAPGPSLPAYLPSTQTWSGLPPNTSRWPGGPLEPS